jgi:hypothetical protein
MCGDGSITVRTELKDGTVCELTYTTGVLSHLLHCLLMCYCCQMTADHSGDGSMTVGTQLKDGTVGELTYTAGVCYIGCYIVC